MGELKLKSKHRLLCGDSTSEDDVARLMDGEKANIMIADPPYGVKYDESWREVSCKDFGGHTVGMIKNDDKANWKAVYEKSSCDICYVWHADKFSDLVKEELQESGFIIRQQIVWVKPFGIMSRASYNWQHEPCWYGVRKGKTASWIGDMKQTTVWEATVPNHPMTKDDDCRTIHPTQKPIECMARPISNHEGDVYDPFMGSGTTLIACEKLNRKCFGMEIDPLYCDVIVKRWENLTGETAQCESVAPTK